MTVESELIAWVDVDGTLVDFYNRPGVMSYTVNLNYYGKEKEAVLLKKNIEFVRSLKKRGYFIIVHTNNGYRWGEEVVRTLELGDCVDLIMSKPSKVLDNEDPSVWLPKHINLGE